MIILFNLFGPSVFSDKTIKKYMRKKQLIETDITEDQIQPNSVDLRISNSFRKIRYNHTTDLATEEFVIDPTKKIEYDRGEFPSDHYYLLKPGEFVLMATKEIVSIPNGVIGFVQGRSSIARLGIQTEQAGLIDAGFRGTITLEIANQTNYPIRLYEGMKVAQIYFMKAQKSSSPYGSKFKGSKYQGQFVATGSKIDQDFKK